MIHVDCEFFGEACEEGVRVRGVFLLEGEGLTLGSGVAGGEDFGPGEGAAAQEVEEHVAEGF